MRRALLVAIAILATCGSPFLYGQAPSRQPLKGTDLASARLAAAKYAIANGVELPSGNLVVAFEVNFERIDVAAYVEATADAQAQAAAIAKAVGHGAKVGSAAQLLTCRQRACAPNSQASVLLIDEPATNEQSVTSLMVRLLTPSNTTEYDALLTVGVIELQQDKGVWTGVRFGGPFGGVPSTARVKLPVK